MSDIRHFQNDGTAQQCIAADMIEQLPDGPNRHEELEIARNSASMAYGAGADTVRSNHYSRP